MSHFAKIRDGIVIKVIVAEPEFFQTFVDDSPGEWVQTSYNTSGNVHYGADGNPDGGVALRGNYAGIGFIYDRVHDVFYPQRPFRSWSLSHETWSWNPPVPIPDDGKTYIWNEGILNWTPIDQ